MTEAFVASNGVHVHPNKTVNGKTSVESSNAGHCLGEEMVQALREFFLHERDKELGRWRDPEDPNMYVITDEGGRLNVVNESTSRWTLITRELIAGYPDVMPGRKTGARYFAAHPEPRPWHDAKAGEVWVLTLEGEPETAQVVDGYGKFMPWTIDVVSDGNSRGKITAGRRIFPEVTP